MSEYKAYRINGASVIRTNDIEAHRQAMADQDVPVTSVERAPEWDY